MDLPEDFDNRAFIIFTAKEMSEPLIMVYVHLSLVVRLKCDKLILTPTELSFLASGHKVWMFPIAYEIHSPPDFIEDVFLKFLGEMPLFKNYSDMNFQMAVIWLSEWVSRLKILDRKNDGSFHH